MDKRLLFLGLAIVGGGMYLYAKRKEKQPSGDFSVTTVEGDDVIKIDLPDLQKETAEEKLKRFGIEV